MRKAQVFVAMNLLLTMNACQKSEELKPFVIHPEDVQGVWIGAVENEAETPSLALYFENSNLETMTSSSDAFNCGMPRPYQIVRNSVVELASTDNCEAAKIQVVDRGANWIKVSYKQSRYKLFRANPTKLEFFVSSSGAQEDELSPAFRPYLVSPNDDSSIDSALKENQSGFYGIKFKFNREISEGKYDILDFTTSKSDQYCILINAENYKQGAEFTVDEIKLELPRDHDNIWQVRNKLSDTEVLGLNEDQVKVRLAQWQAGVLSTQSARVNRVEFTSNDQKILVRCERSLKKSLWTVAEVQEELNKLGGELTIEKIPMQAKSGSASE